MKKILLFLLTGIVLSLSAAPVQLGKIEDYTIVIPSNPTKQERYSAMVLSEYLEKIYKTAVTVKFDRSTIKGNYISIGETKFAKEHKFTDALARQSYSFNVKDKNLFIRGGFPGPLNGVITYLQEDLGCRWFAVSIGIEKNSDPGEVFLPDLKGKNLTVTPRSYTPPFQAREILYMNGNDSNLDEVVFFRSAPMSYIMKMPPDSGADLASDLFIHTYATLVPVKKYYDKHPEYFALQNGKRVKQRSTYGAVCYTHPDIPGVMMERIREELKKNPDAIYFSVSVNDGSSTRCECKNCAPLFEKYNPADVQMMLTNKVAKLIKKEYPNAIITTLVYNSMKTTIEPESNVLLLFAPINIRYNVVKMLVPLSDIPEIDTALKTFRNEKKNIVLWDYMEPINPYIPWPNFDQVKASISHLAKHDVKGYFTDCSNGGASFFALKRYIYSQLLWNPDADMDAMIAEFVKAYYKDCAPEIMEYIALIRNAWSRFIKEYRVKQEGVMLQYTQAEREKIQQLLESALAKTNGKQPLYGRIAREYTCYIVSGKLRRWKEYICAKKNPAR